MSGLSVVWDRFFCACCQTEKPIAKRVKLTASHSRCSDCVARRAGKAGNPKMVSQYIPEDVDTSIPAEILDRYTESAEET